MIKLPRAIQSELKFVMNFPDGDCRVYSIDHQGNVKVALLALINATEAEARHIIKMPNLIFIKARRFSADTYQDAACKINTMINRNTEARVVLMEVL